MSVPDLVPYCEVEVFGVDLVRDSSTREIAIGVSFALSEDSGIISVVMTRGEAVRLRRLLREAVREMDNV